MAFPIASDYFEIFQNPKLNLLDEDLRIGNVVTAGWGLPLQISGSNASVFQIEIKNNKWAVRCFLKEIADREFRYKHISDYINNSNNSFYVPFKYIEKGLIVKGNTYPCIKMKWIKGKSLDKFTSESLNNRILLEHFLKNWLKLIEQVKSDGIAHGDLQHDNILVANDGKIYLIDYDEMYLDRFNGLRSNVTGHPNYQHLKRDLIHFNKNIDDFSAWIIYLSILAIKNDAALWEQAQGGDNCLILRRTDYESFSKSNVFNMLKKSPVEQNKKIADFISSLTESRIDEIPVFSRKNFDDFGKPKKTSKRKPKQKTLPGINWIDDHISKTGKVNEKQSETLKNKRIAVEQIDKGVSPIVATESWIEDYIPRILEEKELDTSVIKDESKESITFEPTLDQSWIDDYLKKK